LKYTIFIHIVLSFFLAISSDDHNQQNLNTNSSVNRDSEIEFSNIKFQKNHGEPSVLSRVEQIVDDTIQSLAHFSKYSVDSLPQPKPATFECQQNIQIIATSPESLFLGMSIVKDFNNDERLYSLNVCMQRPLWLEANELRCIFDQNSQRTRCDSTALKQWLSINDVSHLAFITKEGKAYTYQGIMYLDERDDYDVFVHELAHFAGFMDEYALSLNSAKQHCEPVVGINLIRESSDYTAFQNNLSLWDDQGIQYTMSESKTCEQVNVITLKPSNRLTFMEYHDTAYIPDIYIALWRHQLASGFQYNLMRQSLGLPTITPKWQ